MLHTECRNGIQKIQAKYLGTAEEWDKVESAMREILDEIGLDYTEASGEAAFYGPKLDIQAKNVYGKEDTMITIQLDMFLAERYDMYYIDKNGEKKTPIYHPPYIARLLRENSRLAD